MDVSIMDNVSREEKAITVTELNTYIKNLFDSDLFLNRVAVKGEISNFTNHRSGHFYFSVKDENSLIRAVMFRSAAAKVKFVPEDGMKVIVHGTVSSFVRDGQYQLYVTSMEPDGLGSLYLQFEQLKKKLSAEGLFDESKKKPLPKIPSAVGVITSPTGAAVRDIIQILGRRFPYASVYLYPALVQGSEAPASLIRGLEFFNQHGGVDVIIIGRGGGSMEDLWAFNDEKLARTVAASRLPVISAVGHEIDFTICDFVADKRAPTPSAAAELAVPETHELMHKISNITGRTQLLLSRMLEIRRKTVKMLAERRIFTQPERAFDERRMTVASLGDAVQRTMEKKLTAANATLSALGGKLHVLSPLSVFNRGYSLAENDDRQIIRSVEQVKNGDAVSVRLSDGVLYTTVERTEKRS